jgi:transcriptional regulator with XRE-family HTH domain
MSKRTNSQREKERSDTEGRTRQNRADEGLSDTIHSPTEEGSVGRKERQLHLIGRQVRRLREARGYSQEEVAHIVGLAPNYYGQVERGIKNPSALTLVRIAKALQVEIGELFPALVGLDSEEVVVPERGSGRQTLIYEQPPLLSGSNATTSSSLEDEQAAINDKLARGEVLIGTGKTAQLLGLARRTVERQARKGRLPVVAFIDGRSAVFWLAEIEKLVKTR